MVERVALFVTCLADTLYPGVGKATVTVLERLGVEVVFPLEQTCCGQMHGNSGYLFRFDPRAARVEVMDRITSLPSKRSGMFDQFSYGYLGFALGPDGRTIYYLTGGPIYENGRRVAGKNSTAMGEAMKKLCGK